MKRASLSGLLACVTLFLCGPVTSRAAGVNVGATPTLQFKSATDGANVNLADYKGKVVVIDFWATWCGPCMAEADHMVAVNKKYAPQGMVMLGVSLDSSVPDMKGVAKEKNFDWPQACDGGAWESKFAKAFGVNSIPQTFVIGADGAVAWRGHPGNGLDKQVEAALKSAVTLVGGAALDQVEAALARADLPTATKALALVPPAAKEDATLAPRLGAAQAKLAALGDQMFAEVDPLLSAKQYAAAMTKLRELSTKLAGTPPGEKAKAKLASLMADPKVKAEIETAERQARADAALTAANNLKAAKKDEQAYAAFKEVAATFAGTPAAATAAKAVAEYERDPALVQRANDAAVGAKAKAALSMADSYKAAGKAELARKKYQDVIGQYPGTSYAAQAKEKLAGLGT